MCKECCGEQTANPSEESENLREQMIVAEYNNCRDMIKKNIEIMERNTVFAVTAIAAIVAFCINKIQNTPPQYLQNKVILALSCMPVAITILGFLRFKSIDRAVNIYNNYIQYRVEPRFRGMRFTAYFRCHNNGWPLRRWHWIFWGVLLLLTVVFLCFVLFNHAPDGFAAHNAEAHNISLNIVN